jgi:hypothetical protein
VQQGSSMVDIKDLTAELQMDLEVKNGGDRPEPAS